MRKKIVKFDPVGLPWVKPIEVEAVEMTAEQFAGIRLKRDTPDFTIVDGVGFWNSHTCLSGYSGTCNCFSHPRKEWRRFDPVSGRFFGRKGVSGDG